ncbi:putative RNA methyltransferase [Actinomadura scrupuli]|uniref:putative RNA methyltransferase n=1 Tax=Actinomadura scrupuli TaxID=559629 RepID=UPI003D95AE67
MLTDVVELLTCPVCGAGLTDENRVLRCLAGHCFDIARQGYVNLLSGDARAGTADTMEMVAARAAFLGAGHFSSLAARLAEEVADGLPEAPRVLDAGAGTGHYLGAVLDRVPGATGIALDVSKFALRRAVRAHPRIGAVVWDLWRPLPVRTASINVIMNVFAPRNGAEFHRVLRPDGALVVVTPTDRHLGELVGALGLLSVDERKPERMAATLGEHFRPDRHREHEFTLCLSHAEVETLVGMGPSAGHIPGDELRRRLTGLPDPVKVTASFRISRFAPV